jgi:hypothetical protein
MKMLLKKSAVYLMILSLGLAFMATSCEKEPVVMALPDAESLVIDWSMFPSNAAKSTGESEIAIGNWFYSAGTIVVWNTVVAANIAIPIVAYDAALNQTPVYLGDNTWQWSYSFPFNQRTINARLVGSRIDNETFSMEMHLSETGGFGEFKWFEGVIRYDHTAATWTLSHSPGNPVEYLEVAYTKDFETEVHNIRYTIIDPENDLYNGYIDFGVDPALELDAHYTLSGNQNTTWIEWNTETKAGRVKDQNHFADALWHCWDTMLQDVNCPEE